MGWSARMPAVTNSAPVAIQRTPPRRVAAAIALVTAVLMPVVVIEVLVDDVPAMLAALAAVAISAYAGWHALTRRRVKRWAGLVGAVVAIGMLGWLLVDHDALPELIVVAVLAVVSISASRLALGPRRDLTAYGGAAVVPGRPVAAAQAGVLFLNPLAGRGKVERLSLADEARTRGIEPVVFDEGDDLETIANAAVDDGADVLGVAGGDGSQSRVAKVAMQRGRAVRLRPRRDAQPPRARPRHRSRRRRRRARRRTSTASSGGWTSRGSTTACS